MGEGGGANERGDIARESRGRVATVFFPALLRRGGSVSDDIAGGATDHRIGVEVGQRTGFGKTPGQHDRKGNLVELDTLPIGVAVDPEILREAAVLALGAS